MKQPIISPKGIFSRCGPVCRARVFLSRTLITCLIILGVSTAACSSANQPPSNPRDIAMDTSLPSDAVIKRDDNGVVYYLKGINLSAGLESDPGFRRLQEEKNPAAIALAFMTAHRELFGLDQPKDELSVISAVTDDLGLSHVKFQQMFKGIHVWGSEMIVHLDRENRVYLVQGRHIPTPDQVTLQPGITASGAAQIVAEDLETAQCPRCRAELFIYAPEGGKEPCLAWRVEASVRPDAGWMYFIHAVTGRILDKLSTVRTDG